jgi:AAA domain, putative AbiEii toxin, Type IV TA system
MTDITILDLKLVRLTLDQIGPFQDQMTTFDFVDVQASEGSNCQPANLYMLLAKNGHGKTTVLESIYGLFGLLTNPPQGRFVSPFAAGRVQGDFRVVWRRDRQVETIVLSIWTGSRDPLLTPESLHIEGLDETSIWARIVMGRNPGAVAPTDGTTDEGLILYREIQQAIGSAPSANFGVSQHLPTVLFFPADRTVSAPDPSDIIARPHGWGYQPAQTFRADGPEWQDSIDNLLVWLDWLDESRLQQVLEFVNPKLFITDEKRLERPDRETLRASVHTNSGPHLLSELSHGERALLQLFIRVACHMTRNTIVIIDEIETHLHSKWMNRMFQALKIMAKEDSRLSVIFSTHSRELVDVFGHTIAEPGLIKGGFLIEDDMD